MADVALKATEVSVLKMHLAIGIGGKGYFNLAGELADVEAALDAVRAAARSEQVIGIELIPRPHPEVRGFMG
jgi:microcompartment protein CcmL/EutN